MFGEKHRSAMFEAMKAVMEASLGELDPEKCGELVCTADRLAQLLSKEGEVFGVKAGFDRALDMGIIILECSELSIIEPLKFCELVSDAEFIDAVPGSNGRLGLIVSFTDILKEAKDEE